MTKRTQKITMKQLRRMIQEEADLLQGKDDPADVSPDEMPWEEAEDVGKVDFVASMDKPTPSVKKESHMRRLQRRAQFLTRRLNETKRQLKQLQEARARRRRK